MFFVFDFLPDLSSLPDIFHYQPEPSCSGCPIGLFSFNCILVLYSFLDGQSLVAVSALTLLKSSKIKFPILFLSCFPLTASQNFMSVACIRWKIHMNEAQCHIIFYYFSDTVHCFCEYMFDPGWWTNFTFDDTLSVLLLSGQIVTLLWGDCVCNGDSVWC